MALTASNIDWDIDPHDAAEYLINDADPEALMKVLSECNIDLSEASDNEKMIDLLVDGLRHRPGAMDDLYGLPSKVEVPAELESAPDEDITNWLSDTYGTCVNNYDLSRDTNISL